MSTEADDRKYPSDSSLGKRPSITIEAGEAGESYKTACGSKRVKDSTRPARGIRTD